MGLHGFFDSRRITGSIFAAAAFLFFLASCSETAPSDSQEGSSGDDSANASVSSEGDEEIAGVDPDWKTDADIHSSSRAVPSGLLPNSFDKLPNGFEATVIGLGHVSLSNDGTASIHPSPATTSEGEFLEPEWKYETSFTKLTRGSETIDVGTASSASQTDREVRYEFEDSQSELIYERRDDGLEQKLRLEKRHGEGEAPLELHFSVPDRFELEKKTDQLVVVELPDGRTAFAWKKLKVRDARGETVPAGMDIQDGQIVYRIEDADAQYPLYVDPLAQRSWQNDASEEETSSSYGQSMLIETDVDGNGYDDLFVAQPAFGTASNPPSDRGRVLLYLSDSNGLSNSADWILEGTQTGEEMGLALHHVGNIDPGNGDPEEFAVGAWQYDDTPSDGSTDDHGRIHLYLGTSQLSKSNSPQQNANALGSNDWSYSGNDSDAIGRYAVGAGDVNCDGTTDLAIGAPFANSFTGDVRVFYGTSSQPYFPASPDESLPGDSGGDFYGFSVEFLNADGQNCDDLAVGSFFYDSDTQSGSNHGKVDLFLGSSSGLNTSPSWTKEGDPSSRFGVVSSPGDINGDGMEELAVGAYTWPISGSNSGKVFLYRGSSAGLEQSFSWDATDGQPGSQFGISVDSGDINGDGNPDLIVGAHEWEDSNGTETGRVVAYLGTPSGLQNNEGWSNNPSQAESRYGQFLNAGGDLNNDGVGDLAVGAFTYDTSNTTSAGRVFVYDGSPNCFINGEFYDDGEQNPDNECEHCDASTSTSSWSADTDKDGDSCTPSDQCIDASTATCNSGSCTGQMKNCDDGLSCTTDSCDSSTGCVYTVDTGCAIDGTCYADGDVNPNNECEHCDPSVDTKSWSPKSQGASCSNGKFCTVDDVCDGAGNCTAGPDRDCSDVIGVNNECADDVRCNDTVDQCEPISPKNSGNSCDDGNACTTSETCSNGLCSGSRVECSDPCAECDPETGSCDLEKDDGTSCDSDDDVCTVEACQGGSCTQEDTEDCDDGNPCTQSGEMMCDAEDGCPSPLPPEPQGTACGDPMCDDDGNLVEAPVCDGSGNCEMASVQDCGDFECRVVDGTPACPESCTDDEDCKEGSYCIEVPGGDGERACSENRPPEADAGLDQETSDGLPVTLDGSQSSDPDGDELSFQWELADTSCPQGGEADLEGYRTHLEEDGDWNPEDERAEFTAKAPDCAEQILTFELVVNDGEFDSEPDESLVQYGECDQTPNAQFSGLPAEVEWGQSFELDGSESTPGCGDELTFSWSHEALDDDAPQIETTEAEGGEILEVTLPEVCREQDTGFEFGLGVHDGVNNSPETTNRTIVQANGPCEGDGTAEPGPDAGPTDGGTDFDGDLSGSSCFCSAGSDEMPMVPASLLVFAVVGGFLRLRRRQ